MIYTFLLQIRINHWLKNTLVFLPAISSQKIFQLNILIESLLTFFAFSFIASSIYLVNDLIDVNKDRLHPYKKLRPYAANLIKKETIYLTILFFTSIGITLSLILSFNFFLILVLYVILNFLYFNFFKKIIILDAFILMFFYLTRVISGHIVNNIEFSLWLLTFVFFIFLSLSFLKKFTDIKITNADNRILEYRNNHLQILKIFGLASSVISAFIIILYSTSNSIKLLYSNEYMLLLVSPIILFWSLNTWLKGIKGLIKMDPVSFVVRQKYTYICLVLIISILFIAK